MEQQLRPYQEKALNSITEAFNKKEKEFVLASCPSSGKTTISLELVRRLPNIKVLVLPHGTNVLKTQWEKQAVGLSNCKIDIPQNLYNKSNLEKFDILIIDEAHEYTDAKMVQDIIKKTKPKFILYLTGTPSNFIKKGSKVYVIAAEELIPEYISDLYVGVFSTTANFTMKDYNEELDVKKNKEHRLTESAEEDFYELIKAMKTRLEQTGFFKSEPFLSRNGLSIPTIFGRLKKTMIACNNEKQLKVIQDTLKKEGVIAVASISKNDQDSIEIENFINNKEISVLLVLRRGILGFNMEHLVNVVDMTGSHNINRIYQLYARVMRKHPDYDLKYFFKLTSDSNMDITKFYMNAALNLMRKDFISKYNGKNLNEMEIKVLKPRSQKRSNAKTGNKKRKNNSIIIDEFFYETIKANALLTDLWSKSSKIFNEYAQMRIGSIKERQFKIPEQRKIVNITEENVLWMIKHGKVDERIYGHS